MKEYSYKVAKIIIDTICEAAKSGIYDTREKFIAMLDQHEYIAVQGYNPYGEIFHWNAAAELVYGYREAEAVNQDLFDLILPEPLRELARTMVNYAAKTGHMPDPGASDLLRKNGECITVYSGHLVFEWENHSPEFYCIDLPLEPDTDPVK
jgi:PAS domain S-box-containing protein